MKLVIDASFARKWFFHDGADQSYCHGAAALGRLQPLSTWTLN